MPGPSDPVPPLLPGRHGAQCGGAGRRHPSRLDRCGDAGPHALRDKQRALEQDYGIASFERWDYDQSAGTLTFSAGGVPRVVAEAFAKVPDDQPIVLDGMPRTQSDLDWLDQNLPRLGRE